MAVKFLDLDTIHRPVGRLRLSGTDYDVYPMSVKSVINIIALDEQYKSEVPGHAYIGAMMTVLEELVPHCPKAEIEKLTLFQLQELVTWARDLTDGTMEKNSEPLARNLIETSP